MTNETQATTQQKPDSKTTLRNLYKEYCGKEPDAALTGTQIREALRATEDYKRIYAARKDEAATLDEMLIRVLKDQRVPAILINANAERKWGNKVTKGATFMFQNGSTRTIDYGGPMPNAPPVLTEYVFPGGTIVRDIANGTESIEVHGKPVQESHGKLPSSSDLTDAIQRCWYWNAKAGCVSGRSYGDVFATGVVGDESSITIWPPGEFSEEPRLEFLVLDAAKPKPNGVKVKADAAMIATQLGIPIDSPAKVWRMKLAGRPVAISGRLSVFHERYNKFFGGPGSLEAVAAAQGTRIQGTDAKDPNACALNLSDLYDPMNPKKFPAIPVGDKWVYRLESFGGESRSRPGEAERVWKAYVRVDQEEPNAAAFMDCGKSGAFATLLGVNGHAQKVSAEAQALLGVE